MSGSSIEDIDFEYWSLLASTDPEKFEQLRQDQIDLLIEKASSQRQKRRLRGLQWRIDKIREQHKDSAMSACIAISELMWETFEQLSGLLHSIQDDGFSAPVTPMQANVIPFPVKQKTSSNY
ncbi:MAG: DUF3135 domain-containing protein [Gammaproteobacteria bacterium]|nr:DUF3135 domain-containing protein [Gammaproteobacteria bacterium]